jgi:hypothetical protein
LGESTVNRGAPLTINLNPRIVNTVNGLIAQEVRGDVRVSGDEKELNRLITEHGEEKSVELSASVQLLSDSAISHSERLASAQKLKGFVYKVAEKIGGIATTVLTSYIDKKLGLT